MAVHSLVRKLTYRLQIALGSYTRSTTAVRTYVLLLCVRVRNSYGSAIPQGCDHRIQLDVGAWIALDTPRPACLNSALRPHGPLRK